MSRPGFSISARKEDGEWFFDQKLFKRLAQRLKDGDYDFIVEKHSDNRSLKQNAFYHAVIVELLAEYWGLEHDIAHELIKQHCNKQIVNVVNKTTGEVEEITIGASTANLKKDEWGQFIERCQRWAAEEFDVVIPDPDPEHAFNAP